MRRPVLLLLLLIVCVLGLTGFVLCQDALRGRESARSALAVLFGDGRRLFANHFLAKADAYFHRGRYPSFFETAERERGNHLVESLDDNALEEPHVHDADCGHEVDEEHVHGPECDHSEEEHAPVESCEHGEPAQGANDWIARLARRLQPDQHVHLESGGQKEMLPWVKLAVEMDPHNVDAYAVGAFWLREMGKPGEAEAFLREAQRNNPESSEIYFELGRLQELEGGDLTKVARLYELSLEKWRQSNVGAEEPDTLSLSRVLGRLGNVKELQGENDAALYYYKLLKAVSPSPDAVQGLIDSLQTRMKEVSPPSQAF